MWRSRTATAKTASDVSYGRVARNIPPSPCLAAPPRAKVTAGAGESRRTGRQVRSGSHDGLSATASAGARLARAAVLPLLLLAAVAIRVPWSPALPSDGLDPAWFEVLLRGFLDGTVFGRDLIFMNGPLSFLYTTAFHPALYPWALLYDVLVTGATLLAACSLLRHERLAWYLPLGLAALLPIPTLWNTVLLLPPLLAAPLWTQSGRGARSLALLLVALAAIGSYAKFSIFLAAAPLLPLTDLLLWWRQRRPPLLSPLFLLMIVATHLACGQPLGSLPDFLGTSLALAAGYGGEVALPGPEGWAWQERACFLALSAALLLGGAWLARRRDGPARPPGTALACLAGLAVGLFTLWKTGFVRHDTHAISAWGGVPLLALVTLLPLRPGRSGKALLLAVILAASGLQLAALQLHLPKPWPDSVARILNRQMTGMGRLLSDPVAELRRLAELRDRNLAKIARRYDLPDLPGRGDVIVGPGIIFPASGLGYAPRPLIYGYVATTPSLLALNRQHLEGDGRPDWLLWRVSSIDERYPATDDGQLWPLLLAGYDLAGKTPDFLVMRARAAPRQVSQTALTAVALAENEWIEVPDQPALLWLQIDLRPSFAGRALDFLWRLPLLWLEVEQANGEVRRYRLPPVLAAQGFLLAPFVPGMVQLEQLALGRVADIAPRRAPRRLRIVGEELAATGFAWPAAVVVSRLAFDPPLGP